jgi:hypothetical protein
MMKHFKVFAFALLTMLMVAGSAAFASHPAQVIWWELEAQHTDHAAALTMAEMIAAFERPKTLILRQGTFPPSGDDKSAPGQSLAFDDASVWIRNPDGVVSAINPSRDNGTITLNLPSDLNAGELNGRYLVGVHLNYRKKDGIKGENPDVFFKYDDKIALEIGPFFPKSMFKKAGCPHADAIKGSKGSKVGYVSDGGNQSSLKEYKMKVLYKGRPLVNADVIILSKTGWKKTLVTDSEGAISITPPKTLAPIVNPQGISHFRGHGKPHSGIGEGTKKDSQGAGHKAGYAEGHKVRHANRILPGGRHTAADKLLYVVAYEDPATGEYHCATLPMSLGMFSRDGGWLSMSSGFASWGIIGAGLGIVGVGGGIYHRKKRNRETIFKSKKL